MSKRDDQIRDQRIELGLDMLRQKVAADLAYVRALEAQNARMRELLKRAYDTLDADDHNLWWFRTEIADLLELPEADR